MENAKLNNSSQALQCEQYRKLAKKIRISLLKMISESKASHVGTGLSMADVLAVLYCDVLRVDPSRPDWPERDRFVLSKGHGCAAVYAVLAECGFFPKEWLDTYYRDGGRLAGHMTHKGVPGVEVSTGSLGHGLSIACGMALVGKRENLPYRIFTLLSDGECDEGSTWEAVLFAGHHKLDNLVAIVDYNKIQSLGRVENVLDLEPFVQKWKAFRWSVREIDGHNHADIKKALSNLPMEKDKPNCVIAHTVKGKGVSFMEDLLLWHYRTPNKEDLKRAMEELDGKNENSIF